MKTNRGTVIEIEQSVATDFPASCQRTVFVVTPFGNLLNQTITDQGTKFVYKQTEVRECLLLFGAESIVFQFAIQKFKD